MEYGDWFDNVLSWEKEVVKGDYNIHPVYYEDLKDVKLYETQSQKTLFRTCAPSEYSN